MTQTFQTLRDPDTHDVLVRNGVLARPVHVVASPFKTGTSSVGQALLDLGVGTAEMAYDGALLRHFRPQIQAANKLASHCPRMRVFKTQHRDEVRDLLAELVIELAPYDVFSDAPFGHTHMHPFVRKLLAPKARFIWVDRAPEDWLASVRNWEITHPELYPRQEEWRTDPEGRAALKLRNWRRSYMQFQRLTKSHAETCLELTWEDLGSYDALAAFYDVPVPGQAFPRRNVSRGEMPEIASTPGSGCVARP